MSYVKSCLAIHSEAKIAPRLLKTKRSIQRVSAAASKYQG